MKNSDDSGYTGKHVGVCVLDTGIFPHIDFTGRILAFQDFIGHRIRPYDDNSHGTEQLSLKLMGISPLHGSHPAVPFASGATSSHGLRLYGSIIITIERSWRQLLR